MNKHYLICVNNSGYGYDLKLRTVYQSLPDDSAERSGFVRIIDETGEDYLFPADYFAPIELPDEVEKLLFAA